MMLPGKTRLRHVHAERITHKLTTKILRREISGGQGEEMVAKDDKDEAYPNAQNSTPLDV